MLYALIEVDGTIRRFDTHELPPPALAPAKGLRWLPVADETPEPGPESVVEGPVLMVGETAVARVWTLRPKTYAELLADCHAKRREAYPAIGDQLDALGKAFAAIAAAGTALPAGTLEWLAAIAAVKAAYPKPVPPE